MFSGFVVIQCQRFPLTSVFPFGAFWIGPMDNISWNHVCFLRNAADVNDHLQEIILVVWCYLISNDIHNTIVLLLCKPTLSEADFKPFIMKVITHLVDNTRNRRILKQKQTKDRINVNDNLTKFIYCWKTICSPLNINIARTGREILFICHF